MPSIGNLVVTIGADIRQLHTGLAKASAAVSGFVAESAASLLAGGGLVAAAAGFITLAAGVERTAVQFGVLLGSATAAKKLLDDIRQFSIKSPFGTTELQSATNVLLNFGVTAKNIMPALSFLGDIAAGDAEKLGRLTLAFAQMSSAGRLMGQDLLQMVNAGFNPLQEISRTTGESMISLKKRMEAGGVSTREVTAAFVSATSAGGRFFGMTDKIAATSIGKWMMLKDQVSLLAISIGNELLPVANRLLSVVTRLVEENKSWIKTITLTGLAVAALAIAVKAITIATQAYTKAIVFAKLLSGPKEWLMMAVGLGLATAAMVALESQFASANAEMLNSQAVAPEVTETIGALGDSMESAAAPTKHIQTLLEKLNEEFVGLKDAGAKSLAELEQAWQDALKMFDAGQVSFQGMQNLAQAFNKITQSRSGFTEAMRSVTDEIRILSGQATAASIELERMASFGVRPEALDQLRKLQKERDDLVQAQRDAEEEARKAEAIRRMQEQDMIGFNGPELDLVENGQQSAGSGSQSGGQQPGVGFAQRGSAEAAQLVLATLGRGKSADVEATEKQTKELIKNAQDVANQMLAGMGGVVAAFGP